MSKIQLTLDGQPFTLKHLPGVLKSLPGVFKVFIKSKSGKIALFLVLGYILDAWIPGSIAVSIKNYKLGLTYFRDPFLAAIKIPFAGVDAKWLAINLILLFVGLIIFALIWLRFPELISKFKKKDLTFVDDPTCGSARWMPEDVIQEVFDTGNGNGIVLGALNGEPLRFNDKDNMLNHNTVVFGPPKTGKSVCIIIPNALQSVVNQESVVMVDPKGEIARETLKFFKNNNYIVRVFNLKDMQYSDHWNPMDEVETGLDAQLFTQIVITNTAVPGVKKIGGDAFWDRAEQNLLKALVLYAKMEYPPEKQTMADVYDLLASGDIDMLDLTFSSLPEKHPAKASYNIYAQAGRAKGDIIQGLGTRLQVFQDDHVRELTSKSDIDLEAPGKTQCAYYCIIPDTDSTFEFLSSLFFSFLFLKLTRLGDLRKQGCEVPINFLLDEFCNVGAIPDFKKKIATMRSRNIACTIISQSLPQLRDRYPQDSWKEILSCCAFKLFLGCADNDTAEYLIQCLGDGTIEQTSLRRDSKDISHVARTKSMGRRKLMDLAEALKIPRKEEVLLTLGRDPLRLNKYPYFDHPLGGTLIEREVSEYTPVSKEPEKPRFVLTEVPEKKDLFSAPEALFDPDNPETDIETPEKSEDSFWG